MTWHEEVLDFMRKNAGLWTAGEIARALCPDAKGFKRDHARGAVYHALSVGVKYGFFEKIGQGKNVRWRVIA